MTTEKGPSAERDRWLKRIEAEKKAHEVYRRQAKEAERSYYDRSRMTGEALTENLQLVPLFWSSTNVLHAALFSRMPRPDVRKRNTDVMDGVAKEISLMTERAVTFVQDTTGYDNDAHQSVNDFLVCALGQGKIEMDVETAEVPVINPIDGQPIVLNGEPLTQTKVVSRTLRQRYVHWKNYHWEPTTSWDQVTWMAYDHWMSREELEKQFDIKLPEKANGSGGGNSPLKADKYEPQFCVHEIWDKTRREVVLICDAYDDVIETREDPLGLKDFFPSPRPMLANVEGEEVIPKPDFTFIRDMLKLVNLYAKRIRELTGQIKDWGYYDSSFTELAKVNQATDGTFFPVAGIVERMGLAGSKAGNVVYSQDNSNKVQVIMNLIDQFERQKALLWETIGISDITRGQTNPNETASAQRIKDQWANVRLAPKLNTISQFFRDCFRIMAEIISEKFEPEQIFQMTGVQVTPEMEQVMQDDFLRTYAIDVETDSTIAQDDNLEREQRNETSEVIGNMLTQMVPAINAGQLPADIAKALMLFTVRTTKFGSEFEDAINQLPDTMQQLGQMQQQVQQGQQQAQQLQQQLQEAQTQLQKVNQGKEQRENIETQAGAQEKAASSARQQADALETMQRVQMGHVLPLAR